MATNPVKRFKTPILTEVEVDAAWHFSPANRDSFCAAWAHQPRVVMDDKMLVILGAQLAKAGPYFTKSIYNYLLQDSSLLSAKGKNVLLRLVKELEG